MIDLVSLHARCTHALWKLTNLPLVQHLTRGLCGDIGLTVDS